MLTFGTARPALPQPPAPAEARSLANWIDFTVGGAFVSGNDAGMMRRTQTNGDFYGGIESLQYSKALNDSTTLTLDGHALPGLEDYEFNLDLKKTISVMSRPAIRNSAFGMMDPAAIIRNVGPATNWVVALQ